MLSSEERPALPATPQFCQDMERALVSAARAGAAPRPGIAGLSRRTAASIAVAAAALAGVGIGYAVSAGQPAGGHLGGGHGKAGHGGQIHAAFSVDKTGQGTVTVTLMRNYVHIDPAALRHALAAAGVPALVTAGRVCAGPGPSAVVNQVLGPSQHLPDGTTVLTIRPAAIPRGQELSIGFFAVPGGGSGIHITVVPEKGQLTCTPLPQRPPGG